MKTWCKTYNQEFPTINKAFMIWHHDLKTYKYKNLVFVNPNNFYQFMNIKS